MRDRLFIRPFQLPDTAGFTRNVLQCADLHAQFGIASPFSETEAAAYVKDRCRFRTRRHFHDYVILLQRETEQQEEIRGEPIGEINAAWIAPDSADIGFVIAAAYRNQGYCTEAIRQLEEKLAEDGVRKMYGACERENAASAAVMKRCGMKRIGKPDEKVREKENMDGLVWFYKEIG
ncbi:MAG: GNAT family N-acetyltransferase [Solobacterium sp.]|nr:GNAT family N-acetyltransferase [Solobacterium sp.]